MRPRLLDLFCGAGGCSVGYHRAGFDVVGVDLAPQPDYPFELWREDAMAILGDPTSPLGDFDVVHASPPCQAFSALRTFEDQPNRQRLFPVHVDHLTPTLAMLRERVPVWIVENVERAPMPPGAITLCGSSFGLGVRRHRLFASSATIRAPQCRHKDQPKPVTVGGHSGTSKRMRKAWGAAGAAAMGVDWTTRQAALAQMIPPAYTEHVGRQLLSFLADAA